MIILTKRFMYVNVLQDIPGMPVNIVLLIFMDLTVLNAHLERMVCSVLDTVFVTMEKTERVIVYALIHIHLARLALRKQHLKRKRAQLLLNCYTF